MGVKPSRAALFVLSLRKALIEASVFWIQVGFVHAERRQDALAKQVAQGHTRAFAERDAEHAKAERAVRVLISGRAL